MQQYPHLSGLRSYRIARKLTHGIFDFIYPKAHRLGNFMALLDQGGRARPDIERLGG